MTVRRQSHRALAAGIGCRSGKTEGALPGSRNLTDGASLTLCVPLGQGPQGLSPYPLSAALGSALSPQCGVNCCMTYARRGSQVIEPGDDAANSPSRDNHCELSF